MNYFCTSAVTFFLFIMLIFPFILLVSFTVTSSKPSLKFHPLSDEFIDEINRLGSTWRAKRNIHHETPMSRIQKLSGSLIEDWTHIDEDNFDDDDDYDDGDDYIVVIDSGEQPTNYDISTDQVDIVFHDKDSNIDLLATFDAREKWPNCPSIGQIKDQSSCGSCWAVATTAMITDRICIHSNGLSKPEISTEDLLTCGSSNGAGCNGGYTTKALKYWVRNGISTGGGYGSKNGCKSYSFISCSDSFQNTNSTRPPCPFEDDYTPKCENHCDDYRMDYKETLHFGETIYKIDSKERLIQQELLTNGPVVASFAVFTDFLHYHKGIYKYLMGDIVGHHAVKVIGWGEEYGTPYWLIANSYNEEWGENGYFRIIRGTNECNIETFIYAGIPKLNASVIN